MKFRVVNGPLITLARQAQQSPESTFVLLIDLINRGNVPAIFGELYYIPDDCEIDKCLQMM